MKTKKVIAVLIALALLISMTPSAFAEILDNNDYSAQTAGFDPISDQIITDTPNEIMSKNDHIVSEQSITGIYELDNEIRNSAILNYIDAKTLASGGHVSRCPELESLSSYVFKNADGTRTAYFMDHPVKYIASDGTVKEIDLTLKEKTTGKGYETTASAVSLNIGSLYSDGVTVYLGTIPVTLTASQSPDSSAVKRSASTETVSTVTTNVSEYALTYNNLFGNGTEVRYTPTYNGVKEEIVISEYKGISSFTFTLKTNGLGVFSEDGIYYVASSQNSKERISLGQTVVYDSKDNICDGTMSVSTVTDRSLYTITVSAPLDFLLDSDTVYPVIIDPEMTVADTESETGSIEDSPIYELKPTINFGAYTFNRVGLASGSYGIGRTVVRLTGLINSPIYQSIDSSQINSVKFYVKESSGYTGRVVDICPLTENNTWTESGVKWENAGAFGSVVSSSTWTSNSFGEFDITQLVRGWKNGTYNEDCGFIMKGADETVNESFLSSEYSANIAYRPYVVFEYQPEIQIGSSGIEIDEGETRVLSATTFPGGYPIYWNSADTSIATVNSLGVVTGIRAGKTTITVSTHDEDGNYVSDQCAVTVCIKDGVYHIQNLYSQHYLQVKYGSLNNCTDVEQGTVYAETAVEVFRLRQMWKIYHLGGGVYSIRPMNKLNMGLDVTNNNVDIYGINKSDTLENVQSYCEWTIVWKQSGYVFQNNNNSAKTMRAQSTTSGSSVITGTYSESNVYKWNLIPIEENLSGIIVYNYSTHGILTQISTQYIAPDEVRTPADMNLMFVPYSSTDISQTLWWTVSNSSRASIGSDTGTVTGKTSGTVVVTARSSANKTVTYTLSVTAIPNGTYFLKNKQTNYYADYNSSSIADSVNAYQYRFTGGNSQKWIFEHLGDGYYSIRTAYSTTMPYYLSVKNNSSALDADVVLHSQIVTNGGKWKIQSTGNGAYKLTPKTGEANDYVLATSTSNSTNGAKLLQGDYIGNNNSYRDEWFLEPYSVVFYGVTNLGHDHISCLDTISGNMTSNEWNDVIVRSGVIPSNTCKNDLLSTNVFTSRSHGTWVRYSGTNDVASTGILLNDTEISSERIIFYSHSWSNMPSGSTNISLGDNYSNIDIALFIGCETAKGGKGARNLPSIIVEYGARASIGFKEEILCNAANEWTIDFYTMMLSGATLQESVDFACNNASEVTGLDRNNVVICGDPNIRFPQ